jgi:ABC-type antimicrobial peptide transport system permease subunit
MRVLISIVVGILIGLLSGLFIGWVVAPTEYVNSPMTALAQRWRDEYTVMIAAGYAVDRDLNGALERLRRLGVPNVPQYVQEITERYITNSRNVADIRLLVRLAEGFGRLTPLMQDFRSLDPETTP